MTSRKPSESPYTNLTTEENKWSHAQFKAPSKSPTDEPSSQSKDVSLEIELFGEVDADAEQIDNDDEILTEFRVMQEFYHEKQRNKLLSLEDYIAYESERRKVLLLLKKKQQNDIRNAEDGVQEEGSVKEFTENDLAMLQSLHAEKSVQDRKRIIEWHSLNTAVLASRDYKRRKTNKSAPGNDGEFAGKDPVTVRPSMMKTNIEMFAGKGKNTTPDCTASWIDKHGSTSRRDTPGSEEHQSPSQDPLKVYEITVTDRVRQDITNSTIDEGDSVQRTDRPIEWQKSMKAYFASFNLEDHKKASTDRAMIERAKKSFFGRGCVSMREGGVFAIKGMRTLLKDYQLIAAGEMRERETQPGAMHGGILALAAGMGKTIVALSNIVNGRKPLGVQTRSTLVVCPASLKGNWREQVEEHCYSNKAFDRMDRQAKRLAEKYGLRVMTYAKQLLQSGCDIDTIESHDIVITTYDEVRNSHPSWEAWLAKFDPDGHKSETTVNKAWQVYFEGNCGIFHRLEWHRIVLDEGHRIKSPKSATSIACRALKADNRWVLTATPLDNEMSDLYAIKSFLQDPNIGGLKTFKRNFCNRNDTDHAARANADIGRLIFCRTHGDLFNNKPLLPLPKIIEREIRCELDPLEKLMLDISLENFYDEGKATKQSQSMRKSILPFIDQHRRLLSHPILFYHVIQHFSDHQIKLLHECAGRLHSESCVSAPGTRVRRAREAIRLKDGIAGPFELRGRSYGQHVRCDKYWDCIRRPVALGDTPAENICVVCGHIPENAQIAPCLHLFCKDCILGIRVGSEQMSKETSCPKCSAAITQMKPFTQQIGNESRAPMDQKHNPWINLPGPMMPSTKTLALKAQVEEWMDEDPAVKIIIFTEFRLCIELLKHICTAENWKFTTSYGAMSTDAQDRELRKFKTSATKNILLASIGCVGTGHNLKEATRIIILEPNWKASTEEQAAFRILRLGQTKETVIVRIHVKGSIDEHVVGRQQVKANMAAAMLDSARNRKLTLSALKKLFGPNRDPNEGRAFELVEDEPVPASYCPGPSTERGIPFTKMATRVDTAVSSSGNSDEYFHRDLD
ncbi:hypothetical protein EJ05DRAFT_498629 [Pseudovirgaria hyperparasitica]|uniref:P-loop containing nucleoside triphosphate hydrolase protein n=1 Tax=Pseudovirgaria hyperparasitica TaxID=470096 RepID=A0A6A6WFB1_9PEZI|nr:uncharacterized protein EJ05DRAFT_498629 [Pseudovirgaria hyperparasitica]KAF2760670.1 hypothetical protein EJ05DRAFT_498629 [Pseudovirgaria hyperparasitica]